jgi:TRAP transporter TAXI family solute receptor
MNYNFLSDILCLYYNSDCFHKNSNCESKCSVKTTKNILQDIDNLKNAKSDIIIIPSNLQNALINGTQAFKGQAFPNLRGLFYAQEEFFTVITSKKATITNLGQLQGKKVNISDNNLSMKAILNSPQIMSSLKLNSANIYQIPGEKQFQALCDGSVDAIFMITPHPDTNLGKVSAICEISIMPLPEDLINSMIQINPGYHKSYIPAGVYLGIPYEITTLGLYSALVTTEDFNATTAEGLAKAFFSRINKFNSLSLNLAHLDKKSAFSIKNAIPLHKGVNDYIESQKKIYQSLG